MASRKAFAEEYPAQIKDSNFFFFPSDILFAGVFFYSQRMQKKGGRVTSQPSCFLPSKPLTNLSAPCSSLLGVQTFDLLLELETAELPRGDIRDME